MPRTIPTDWNPDTEELDVREKYIKATNGLGLNILEWQKFRYVIVSGTTASKINWKGNPVKADVEEAYLDMGKSHFEAICAFGSTKVSLNSMSYDGNALEFKKNVSDFYFHALRLLDNIARIIYISKHPESSSQTGSDNTTPLRRTYSWGTLRGSSDSRHFREFRTLIKDEGLEEIRRIRNALAHSWQPPVNQYSNPNRIDWPLAIRKETDFYWPHDEYERTKLEAEYTEWKPIVEMMTEDFERLKHLQNAAFQLLQTAVGKFEERHNIEFIS